MQVSEQKQIVTGTRLNKCSTKYDEKQTQNHRTGIISVTTLHLIWFAVSHVTLTQQLRHQPGNWIKKTYA